jgi:hypothetical protein
MKLLIILLLFSLGASGQIVRCHPFYKPLSTELFLDLYPSATLAVSLRKLRLNYSGSCIRVRRSSDNTEQDIGFVNNYLDTASMKTFVGANNGFVVTWYDQSGSGNNATQATAVTQPKIITSGVVNRQDGIACINTATNLYLATSSIVFNGGTFTFISGIGTHNSSISAFFGNRNGGSTGFNYNWSTISYQFSNFAGATAAITITQRTKHISFLTRVSTTNSLWINSTNTNSGTGAYNSSTSLFFIGRGGGVGVTGTQGNANANFYEIIGYASDKTTNRTQMETNLNNFYSIY